jgi:hypothetical protein
VADPIQAIKNWWNAPTQGDWVEGDPQYFQYRLTQTPGRIADLSKAFEGGPVAGLANTGTTGAQDVGNMLAHGSLDPDTTRSLVRLKELWDQRARTKPQESVIYIDSKRAEEPWAYAHEATHSLYDQMNLTPGQNKALGDLADEMGRYTPPYARRGADTRATEAAAYIVGGPPGQSPSQASDDFIRQVTGANPAIGQQIDRLYAYRRSSATPPPSPYARMAAMQRTRRPE